MCCIFSSSVRCLFGGSKKWFTITESLDIVPNRYPYFRHRLDTFRVKYPVDCPLVIRIGLFSMLFILHLTAIVNNAGQMKNK